MSFIRGTEYANKLNSWHNNLEEDRQQRASLRRCSSLLDVYTSSGFRDLLFKLKLYGKEKPLGVLRLWLSLPALCLMYRKMIPPSHLPNGWLRRMAEHP